MLFGFMDKDHLKKYSAYTLAEMLVVLVIISVVLISLPSATKKLFKVKEVKTYHGRFECYWDANGKLNYYYMKERAGLPPEIKEGELNGDVCEFVPPLTYPYLMIHAVGGGGAGGNLTEMVSSPEIVSSYTGYKYGQNYQDKWFRSFLEKVYSTPSDLELFNIGDKYNVNKNNYSTMISVRQVSLKYRKSGGAGIVLSMFFPFVPTGNRFYLYPGKGGALGDEDKNGADGSPSVVQVINGNENCDKTDENASCNIIWAREGKGAAVLDSNEEIINLVSNVTLLGGKHSDFGISAYPDVKVRKSGFSDVIDKINSSEAHQSRVPSDAGDGGNGANHYVKDSTTGFYFHEFDNYQGTTSENQGVNWVPVSDRITAETTYSENCQYKSSGLTASSEVSGGLWLKRSFKGEISTQCTPYGSNYVCAVGYMKRNISELPCTSVCDEDQNKGRCACYTFNSSGEQVGDPVNNFGVSAAQLLNYYRNPALSNYTVNGYTYKNMTIEESIPDNTAHIHCPASVGNEYTVNGTSTPCEDNADYDATKGICKAKKGGDGAIIILW